MEMTPIAHIRSDFATKFGIPRQSGLVEELAARVVFAPGYRDASALRGIEGFSHLWLLWEFSQSRGWSPTVRPPRLGGNKRLGVFATRSPFRPNPIGLSCVRLIEVRQDRELGPVLVVAGADLMDGTPIYDIKPYLPYADCRPDAVGGFASAPGGGLEVSCSRELLEAVPEDKRAGLLAVLAQDPRPRYQDDPDRTYGMSFAGLEVKFRVEGERLTVTEISRGPTLQGMEPEKNLKTS